VSTKRLWQNRGCPSDGRQAAREGVPTRTIRSGRRRVLQAILLTGAIGGLSACTSNGSTQGHAVPGLKVLPAPRTTGSSTCRALAVGVPLRQLADASSHLEGSQRAEARRVMAASATELTGLAKDAPRTLGPSLKASAQAVAFLASHPPSSEAIDSFTTSLNDLASVTQRACHFSGEQ
jgi:hypothetical protein